MKKTVLSLMAAALLVHSTTAQVKESDKPFGVNLAGAEFGSTVPGVFGEDYTYPSASELDYFRSKGFRLIRLPFLWERVQPVLNGELDPEEMGRMIAVIDAAAKRNMVVIPDMHNYCRRKESGREYIIGADQVPVSAVAEAWKKIADVLKTRKNIWGYGIMNEPHDMPSENAWFNIAQAIIAKIRETDKETSIVVGGDSWSSAERWPVFSSNLKHLKDPSGKLVYEAHIYFDEDASGSYRYTYDKELATPMTGVVRATPFVNWLKAHKLRGFVGEYGVPDNDSRWLVTLDNLLKYLKKNAVNGTYWAAGPWWGDHKMAVHPEDGNDRPQTPTLIKYLMADQ